jgi:hypothetical protein
MTLRELATELGENRSVLRKWVIKHFGRNAVRLERDPSGGGQSVLVIDDLRVEQIKEQRIAWRGDSNAVPLIARRGFFYAIRVCPDLSPIRFKFGYAVDVDSRAATHRTTCPTLEIVKTWHCDSFVEQVALVVVSKHSRSVGGEVFDVEDWELVREKLDLFFDLVS